PGPYGIVLRDSGGRGAAVAERLRADGANVVAFARRAELLEEQAFRLGTIPFPGDLTNPGDLQRLVSTTVDHFDGLDVLVNNGGGPPRSLATDVDDEAIRGAFE